MLICSDNEAQKLYGGSLFAINGSLFDTTGAFLHNGWWR